MYEYKILTTDNMDPTEMEVKLNDLGKDGWKLINWYTYN